MGSINHTEYASKGVAGTGLGLGIAGTALGLMNNGGCGCGGILGNLFGNNNCNNRANVVAEVQYVSELQAKIANLEAQRYSDQVAKETYIQTLNDNKELRNELYAFIKPLADEAANNRVNIATLAAEQKCCCEKQELQAQITAGKINEVALTLNGKIDASNAATTGAFNSLNQTIACIQGSISNINTMLDDITTTKVKLCAVCPEPMPRFNSYTAPTTQAPSCGACSK